MGGVPRCDVPHRGTRDGWAIACPSRPPASSEAPLSGKCGEAPARGASPRPHPSSPLCGPEAARVMGAGLAPRDPGVPRHPQGLSRREGWGGGAAPGGGRGATSSSAAASRGGGQGAAQVCGGGRRRGHIWRFRRRRSPARRRREARPGAALSPPAAGPESRRAGGGSNGRGAPARRSWPYLVKEAADWRAGQRGGGGAAPGRWSGPAPPRGWGGSRAWGASERGESRCRGRRGMRGCLPLGSGRAAGAGRARPGAHGAQGAGPRAVIFLFCSGASPKVAPGPSWAMLWEAGGAGWPPPPFWNQCRRGPGSWAWGGDRMDGTGGSWAAAEPGESAAALPPEVGVSFAFPEGRLGAQRSVVIVLC